MCQRSLEGRSMLAVVDFLAWSAIASKTLRPQGDVARRFIPEPSTKSSDYATKHFGRPVSKPAADGILLAAMQALIRGIENVSDLASSATAVGGSAIARARLRPSPRIDEGFAARL
jgi:hypothetical protein